MVENKSGRLTSVDALRGVAALAVVVYHAAGAGSVIPANNLLFGILGAVMLHGDLGVPLFFVISGFCIHLRWAKATASGVETTTDWRRFWKRRFWRLYPTYFIVLCGSMLLVFVAYKMRMHVALVDSYPNPKPKWMTIDFLSHALMLHGFIPMFDRAGGNGAYWTIAREEHLYLLYLILLPMRKKNGPWWTMTAIGIISIISYAASAAIVPVGSLAWLVTGDSALVLWIQWCLGMVAVEGYYGIIRIPAVARSVLVVPMLGFAALVSDKITPIFSAILWGLTFFVLVNWAVQKEKQGKFAAPAWLLFAGAASYSLYLVNLPVKFVVKVLLKSPYESGNSAEFLACVLIIVACACAVGFALFWLVERHFVNRTPQSQLRPKALGVAASHGTL